MTHRTDIPLLGIISIHRNVLINYYKINNYVGLIKDSKQMSKLSITIDNFSAGGLIHYAGVATS